MIISRYKSHLDSGALRWISRLARLFVTRLQNVNVNRKLLHENEIWFQYINKQTNITLLICKTITSSIKMSHSPNPGIACSAPLSCCRCNLPLEKTQADGAILVNLGDKTILIAEPTCATKIWRYLFFLLYWTLCQCCSVYNVGVLRSLGFSHLSPSSWPTLAPSSRHPSGIWFQKVWICVRPGWLRQILHQTF